ncbi:CD80-like immunoglobulin C2-set [Trinorchestia longiramus]|nr:CD80-like immunoglobulin C2-set [Trinorchestia longiramus]
MIMNSSVGPLVEGASLRLVCKCIGGSPDPKIVWFDENDRLPEGVSRNLRMQTVSTQMVVVNSSQDVGPSLKGSNTSIKKEAVVHNTLVLEPIQRSDHNRTLTCVSGNTNLTNPLETYVIISVNVAPKAVKIEGPEEPLVAGRVFLFWCRAREARPVVSLTWYLHDKKLENFTQISAQQTKMDPLQEGAVETASVDASVLSFMPQRKDHGVPLACVASQEDYRLKPVTATKRLEVYYPPSAELRPGRSVNLSAIEEGDDLYFECVVDASPPAYKIVWYHHGMPLAQNVTAGIIVSNHSLVLQRAGRQHSGLYTCMASNIEGDGTSNPLTLTVQCKYFD